MAGGSLLPPAGLGHVPRSGREQPLEERAVALERDAQVLRRDVLAAAPLGLEALALLGEALGKALHDGRDEGVGVLDGPARLVDEAHLDLLPAGLEALAVGEEGRGVVDTGRAGGIGRGGGRGGGGLGGDRVRGRRLAGVVQRVARVAVRVAHVALRLTFGGGRGGVGHRGHRVTGDRVVGPGLVSLEARVVGARRRRDVAGAQALVGSFHSAHLPYVLVPLGGARVVPDALGAGVVGAVGALRALRAGLVVLAEQLDEQ